MGSSLPGHGLRVRRRCRRLRGLGIWSEADCVFFSIVCTVHAFWSQRRFWAFSVEQFGSSALCRLLKPRSWHVALLALYLSLMVIRITLIRKPCIVLKLGEIADLCVSCSCQ